MFLLLVVSITCLYIREHDLCLILPLLFVIRVCLYIESAHWIMCHWIVKINKRIEIIQWNIISSLAIPFSLSPPQYLIPFSLPLNPLPLFWFKFKLSFILFALYNDDTSYDYDYGHPYRHTHQMLSIWNHD